MHCLRTVRLQYTIDNIACNRSCLVHLEQPLRNQLHSTHYTETRTPLPSLYYSIWLAYYHYMQPPSTHRVHPPNPTLLHHGRGRALCAIGSRDRRAHATTPRLFMRFPTPLICQPLHRHG